MTSTLRVLGKQAFSLEKDEQLYTGGADLGGGHRADPPSY